MSNKSYTGDYLHSDRAELIGDAVKAAIRNAIKHNDVVGSIVGYYDGSLTILSVSEYLLHNLGYTHEEFMRFTGGSVRKMFCPGTADFIDGTRFGQIHGLGEGQMLTADGTPVTVRIYKTDTEDSEGKKVWVMSVRVDWEYENLALINRAIQSGAWHMDCDMSGKVIRASFGNSFRKLLGYRDILDFPNRFESWSESLYPDDREIALNGLYAFINDKTGRTKYDIQYRMKMSDGSWEWFRDIAEATRRSDGSVARIAGIIININKEKLITRQNAIGEAFHSAFTKQNLCEYYVDLERNSFEPLKVEPSFMTIFDRNKTWDGLINSFIDTYVCEEHKSAVMSFYDMKRIPEVLLESDGEILLDCCININGEQRWVRNCIMRGGTQQTRYAMMILPR